MPINAQQDNNQVYSLLLAQGTAGTASGTTATVAAAGNPDTGAVYVEVLAGGAGSGTTVTVDHGSITVTGATINTGTVVLSGGTAGTVTGVGVVSSLTTGSISNLAMLHAGTLTQVGTIQNLGVIHNAGTVAGGTLGVVSSVTNVANGTVAVRPQPGADAGTPIAARLTNGTSFVSSSVPLPVEIAAEGALALEATMVAIKGDTSDIVTDIATLAGAVSGTEYQADIVTGTVTQVGTVQNIGVVHNAGTLAGGTISGAGVVTTVTNLANGTIQNSGTTTGVGVVTSLTDGTVRVAAGTVQAVTTVTTLSNLTNGTVRVTAGTVNSGTINAGTINAGTVTEQPYPASQVQPAFAIGTAAVGTLVSAAGVGTGIFINSVSVSCLSGTLDMCLSFSLGSTTNQVVERGLFVPGGGAAYALPHPSFFGTANAALTYQILSGAGTAKWGVTYNTKGTP